eukprot:TRINITY_DN50991_c0_g1_i1.p1 TRINITY_DN50991_c0_g1~~TRINITY_DN50991_c0_g1_i1.p1  ORF type:complete len:431 (+),score=75.59 TRINITY_DN50991_c0_g1_i1:90-1295(+)
MLPSRLALPPRLLCWAPARAFAPSVPPGLGLSELRDLQGIPVPPDRAAHYSDWAADTIPPPEQPLFHRYCIRRVTGAPAGSTTDAQGATAASLLAVLAVTGRLGPGPGSDALGCWLDGALRDWDPAREAAVERVAEGEAPWDDDDDSEPPAPCPADLDAACARAMRGPDRPITPDTGGSPIVAPAGSAELAELEALERRARELQRRLDHIRSDQQRSSGGSPQGSPIPAQQQRPRPQAPGASMGSQYSTHSSAAPPGFAPPHSPPADRSESDRIRDAKRRAAGQTPPPSLPEVPTAAAAAGGPASPPPPSGAGSASPAPPARSRSSLSAALRAVGRLTCVQRLRHATRRAGAALCPSASAACASSAAWRPSRVAAPALLLGSTVLLYASVAGGITGGAATQ